MVLNVCCDNFVSLQCCGFGMIYSVRYGSVSEPKENYLNIASLFLVLLFYRPYVWMLLFSASAALTGSEKLRIQSSVADP
jgi:hypothetical protein